MAEFTQITLNVADGIAEIALNRPDRMNAFTWTMRDELLAAFDAVDADDAVRAVILTGRGRAFCAGADLSGGKIASEGDGPFRDGGGQVALRIFALKKPVVAAINGAAVGIGATIGLPCDARIAATGAKFGYVFSRRGLVLESCASWFLPRIVGIAQALNWSLSGRVFLAEEALAAGLVSEVLAPEALLDRARALCQELTDRTAPVSVALIRQMLWRGLATHHPTAAHRAESALFGALLAAPDAVEGVKSFVEKRAAAFAGKPSSDLPDTAAWWDEPTF